MDFTEIRLSGKTRREHDLLGEMEIPAEYYFGVQTMRAVENFHISRVRLNFFPELIRALADVKQGAAMANRDLGLLDPAIAARSSGPARSCAPGNSRSSSSSTWCRAAPARRPT